MTERRASDSILIQMSHQIGEIGAKVTAVHEYQKDTNGKVDKILEDHSVRIGNLEDIKNKQVGATIGISTVISGLAALISWLTR